jgi:hypothetical protein
LIKSQCIEREKERSPFLCVFRAPCTTWEIGMELGGREEEEERCVSCRGEEGDGLRARGMRWGGARDKGKVGKK